MFTDPRHHLGRLGEELAVEHLERLGYQIIARNHRTRHGELDVIAREGDVLVFCEVKTRLGSTVAGPYAPLISVDVAKRRRLRSLAAQWLAQRPARERRDAGDQLRFDAIGILLRRDGGVLSLEHVEDAF